MKLYNSLSGRKREFVSSGDTVSMYVCGVTPYSECHIGHAMSYIIFDTLRRYLRFLGYSVKYVQNFTDIDDKIIERANKLGLTQQELADEYIARYFRDMDALNIQRGDIYPKATEEIPKMIEVIGGLIEKGYAYQTDDGVYFRVRKDDNYGKLSHQSLDSLMAGARVEVGDEKEHALDFVLWKAAKPGEPRWESPWGEGRPGWHIECTAMALKYLGETLDIHGGGQDLIFPHHENEIAQSESFTGITPFVRFWLHNGLVQLGEEKMSKSLGNLVTVKEVLEQHSADALRLFVLSSHYRSPLTYTDEGVDAAEKGVERLRQALRAKGGERGDADIDKEAYVQRFTAAMDDDLNTSQAIATLFDLARDINRFSADGFSVEGSQRRLCELAGILGLSLEDSSADVSAAPFIDLLVSIRSELRKKKQWELADKIRTSLSELSIVLEDNPSGTEWRHKL
ncbi:MAG: cysteine--tRNA ligase [Chloroflexota bacterium]|nr:cysteine--tRNA ligase [Chloroflexota bacterium]